MKYLYLYVSHMDRKGVIIKFERYEDFKFFPQTLKVNHLERHKR